MGHVNNIIEPVMIGTALLIFIVYHIYLVVMIRRHPLRMAAGQNEVVRERWVDNVMSKGEYIVGVQTIRNTMMASSLLASTSIALSSIVVAFLAQSQTLAGIQGITYFKSPAISNGHRFFVIILFPALAFFCYMQSIRAGNHASYLIGIPYDPTASFYLTPSYVAKVLHRGAIFYTVGTRFYYLAFLAVLWLFGPLPPLIGSITLVILLLVTDRYPNIHREDKSAVPPASVSLSAPLEMV